MKIVKMDMDDDDLEKLAELVREGKLKLHIARTFPLEHIAQAHRMLEQGGFTGKIAISMD